MAQKKKNTRKGPLSEKPILVGFTHEQADLLQQAAEFCECDRTTFIRDSSVAWARKQLRGRA